MGIENRPFAGTWRLNQKKLVQYTPDCLVYVNGDTSVPGCPKCSGRIDLQKYITNVSVDTSVEPGGMSASITLSLPRQAGDSLFQDGQFVLRPGLEIHIYMRGYFPVEGAYQHREGKTDHIDIEESTGIDLATLRSYPYYPVFHGVVTQVDVSYSGGLYNGTLACASMLHFWQFQPMSTSASHFGSRPRNSKNKTTLRGNVFNGLTPFEIIYTLYRDSAGAAAGVSFNMNKKDNQDASNPLDPAQSLFSLNLLYWEKRFNTRMMQLKMHGVNGTMYSSTQQAFLGRLSTKTSNKLNSLQYQDKVQDPGASSKAFLQKAIALNLIRVNSKGEVVKGIGLDEAVVANANGKAMGINLASMQAFVQDLGQIGSVNLFESSYETKLDIANKVREITGWEFYQDVDGDLVYKPPFWNLDTSSSRVYRLEDIDLISLSESSKEPTVTYIKAKNPAFANLTGTGVEGEWGVGGTYVDYRLVAQFGWRSGSFEISYLKDKTALFFAAVHRMDVMNVDMNSAGATIPLRPELRPGYPVYIPSIDTFYYVSGFNHSFQYGGQCTTTLTLTARRTKFKAPGDPAKTGIDAIDLGNLYLPQRPLEVRDALGHPRLSGFPNVVMALDPDQINPLFFVVGSDVEDLGDERTVDALIETVRLLGETKEAHGASLAFEYDKNRENPKYELVVDADNTVTLSPKGGKGGTTVTRKQLVEAGKRYGKGRKKHLASIKSLEESLRTAHGSLEDAKTDEARNTAQAKVNSLKQKIDAQNLKQASNLEGADIQVFLKIVRAIRQAYSESGNLPNPDSTNTILDLLSDKKSNFTNDATPGTYRYYSCSHPDSKHQGQRTLFSSEETGTKTSPSPRLETFAPVVGYLTQPTIPEDGILVEAELGTIFATRGIDILRPGRRGSSKAVSTDKIHSLSFAKHTFNRTDSFSIDVRAQELQIPVKSIAKGITSRLLKKTKSVRPSDQDSLLDLYGEDIQEMTEVILAGVEGAGAPVLAAFRGKLESVYGRYRAPSLQNLEGTGVTKELGRLTFTLRRGLTLWGDEKAFAGLKSTSDKTKDVAASIGKVLAQALALIYDDAFEDLTIAIGSVSENDNIPKEERDERERRSEQFFQTLAQVIDSVTDSSTVTSPVKNQKKRKTQKGRGSKNKNRTHYTPVFPVSDAGGYEVIGSYRYGRGLSIETGGSLDHLNRLQDPLQFTNLSDVEEYVDSLTLGENGQTTFTIGSGKGKLSPEAASRLIVEIGNLEPTDAASLVRRASGGDSDAQDRVNDLLANGMADQKDGVMKTTVTNAAFQLADLQVHVDKKACDCRGTEADVLLQAFGQEGFIGVDANQDDISKAVTDQMRIASVGWAQSQQALRGQVAKSGTERLADQFNKGKGR